MGLNVSVRVNKLGKLELFYYNYSADNPRDYWLETFCEDEGHSGACLEYMYECKPVDTAESIDFVSRWANTSEQKVRIVKRLRKPK